MLFHAHVALHLPHDLTSALPTEPGEALVRLLLDGDPHRRMATSRASAAGILASLFAAIRDAGGRAVRVRDDAQSWIDLPVAPDRLGEAPDPWPRDLPPSWTEEPATFELEAALEATALQGRVVLRHSPRHDPAQGAVTGSMAWAWRPPELQALDEADAQRALEATDCAVVARRLAEWGRRSAVDFARALSLRFHGAPSAWRGDLLVLVPADDDPHRRFEPILRGFDDTARAATWALARRALAHRSKTWPAVDETGVYGRVGRDRFVPGRDGEAPHAL